MLKSYGTFLFNFYLISFFFSWMINEAFILLSLYSFKKCYKFSSLDSLHLFRIWNERKFNEIHDFSIQI